MPSGSPLAGLYSFELDPETEPKHDCDMFDLMEQGVGGSALKTLSPVPKAAPHSRCSVKRVRDDGGQILYHMYREGGGTPTHPNRQCLAILAPRPYALSRTTVGSPLPRKKKVRFQLKPLRVCPAAQST
jgi:hypothetical protein